MRKDVLENFAKFTGRPVTLLKGRIWHRCFPVNFAKFLRIPFLQTPLDECFCTSITISSATHERKVLQGAGKIFGLFSPGNI